MSRTNQRAAAKDKVPDGSVEAVVLRDCWLGAPDDVVVLPAADAAAAQEAGAVDTHPNALAAVKAAQEA